MARYIDADELIAHLKDGVKGCKVLFGSRACGKSIAYGTALGLKSAISFAETLSTTDVVPKSEIEAYMNLYKSQMQKTVAREIFKEIEERAFLRGGDVIINLKFYEKLKKKYTGGEK
jgi:hypothetical protein